MKFTVSIARSFSEYGDITIDAESEEDATAKVQAIIDSDQPLEPDGEWENGNDVFDERIIDVEVAKKR